ncbi:MAG: right-handed parallel beta-helix repeat-containing protein [Chlorobium sp.]|nr:right-handed parallel beta-helix repeat-containing protein [Chlorobium sp.]
MVLLVATVLFLSAPEAAYTQTYYVDSVAGDDANPGNTEVVPWKTTRRLNMKEFAAGDVILFKRGSEWFSAVINVASGDLTFGAYGDGPPPRLVGSMAVTFDQFQQREDGIYYRVFPRPHAQKDWTNWGVQLVMESGNVFYKKVQALNELTGKGQFYYDKISTNLYIRPLDPVSSLTQTIYVGQQENIFEIKHAQINNLVIRDLEISLANRYGVGPWYQGDKVTQGNVLIENNTFLGNAFSAVCLSGFMSYDRIVIRGNIIRMSGAEGIYIGKFAASSALEIVDNHIGDPKDNSFGWAGEGPNSAFNGDGIDVKNGNRGVIIARNTIRHLTSGSGGICSHSSGLIVDNIIQDVSLPGTIWTNPPTGVFVDIDDRNTVTSIKNNTISALNSAGIVVRGNGTLHPPLLIEDNDITLAAANPNAQIIFTAMNSQNVKIVGNKCRGGAYGLALAPVDYSPVGFLVEKNEFLNTSKSPFYFSQYGPEQLKGLVMSSNRVCKNVPVIIEWKGRVSDKTIEDAKKVLGAESLLEISCPETILPAGSFSGVQVR